MLDPLHINTNYTLSKYVSKKYINDIFPLSLASSVCIYNKSTADDHRTLTVEHSKNYKTIVRAN